MISTPDQGKQVYDSSNIGAIAAPLYVDGKPEGLEAALPISKTTPKPLSAVEGFMLYLYRNPDASFSDISHYIGRNQTQARGTLRDSRKKRWIDHKSLSLTESGKSYAERLIEGGREYAEIIGIRTTRSGVSERTKKYLIEYPNTRLSRKGIVSDLTEEGFQRGSVSNILSKLERGLDAIEGGKIVTSNGVMIYITDDVDPDELTDLLEHPNMPKKRNSSSNGLNRLTEKQFEEIYQENHPILVNFLCGPMGAPPDEAKIIAHETLTIGWEKYSNFKGNSKVSTWLISIAKNEYLMMLRNRGSIANSNTVALEDWADAYTRDHSQAVVSKVIREEAMDLIHQGLPAPLREVFELLKIDYGPQEIAQVLDSTLLAAKTKMHRARKRAKEIMGQNGISFQDLF